MCALWTQMHPSTATWTHTRGHRLRRDFVLVNVALFPLVQHSWVLVDWDTGFAHEDHLPTAVTITGWLPSSMNEQWAPLAWT